MDTQQSAVESLSSIIYCWECGGKVLPLEAQHARDLLALVSLIQPVLDHLGPCLNVDHHGYCQDHAIERPCRVQALRVALAKVEGLT
jgi:hypothetical protein